MPVWGVGQCARQEEPCWEAEKPLEWAQPRSHGSSVGRALGGRMYKALNAKGAAWATVFGVPHFVYVMRGKMREDPETVQAIENRMKKKKKRMTGNLTGFLKNELNV